MLDISGDLRGDLLRAGPGIAHVVTGDKAEAIPNAANAWGAIYRDGWDILRFGHQFGPVDCAGRFEIGVEPIEVSRQPSAVSR